MGSKFRVKGIGDLQAPGHDSLFGRYLYGHFQCGQFPGQNDLPRAVYICEDYITRGLFEDAFRLFFRASQARHSSFLISRDRHGMSPCSRKTNQGMEIKCARGMKCGQFSQAVPTQSGRGYPEFLKELKPELRSQTDGRLGIFGLRQVVKPGFNILRSSSSIKWRIDKPADGSAACILDPLICLLDPIPCPLETLYKHSSHVELLGALSWKKHSHSCFGKPVAQPYHLSWIIEHFPSCRRFLFDHQCKLFKQFCQFVWLAGYDSGSNTGLTVCLVSELGSEICEFGNTYSL